MSEVNIDAALVERGAANLSRTDETLVEMTNGCICCTLRDDLLKEVRRLAEERRFDYLLIESTGIAEPLPVASTFEFRDDDGKSLADVARLDTMVTVVDAANLLANYSSAEFLQGSRRGRWRRRRALDRLSACRSDRVRQRRRAEQDRPRQPQDEIAAARSIIRSHNCKARIIETTNADVDLARHPRHRALQLRGRASPSRLVQGSQPRAITSRRRKSTASRASSIRRAAPFDPAEAARLLQQALDRRHSRQGVLLARDAAAMDRRAVAGGRARPPSARSAAGGTAIPQQSMAEGHATSSRASKRAGTTSGATGVRSSCSSARATWTGRRSRPSSTRACCNVRDGLADSYGLVENCPDPFPDWGREPARSATAERRLQTRQASTHDAA